MCLWNGRKKSPVSGLLLPGLLFLADFGATEVSGELQPEM